MIQLKHCVWQANEHLKRRLSQLSVQDQEEDEEPLAPAASKKSPKKPASPKKPRSPKKNATEKAATPRKPRSPNKNAPEKAASPKKPRSPKQVLPKKAASPNKKRKAPPVECLDQEESDEEGSQSTLDSRGGKFAKAQDMDVATKAFGLYFTCMHVVYVIYVPHTFRTVLAKLRAHGSS